MDYGFLLHPLDRLDFQRKQVAIKSHGDDQAPVLLLFVSEILGLHVYGQAIIQAFGQSAEFLHQRAFRVDEGKGDKEAEKNFHSIDLI